MKEIFSDTSKVILQLAGFRVRRLKPVPTEICITKTFSIDLLFETRSKIFQVEIQSHKDPSLARRMFEITLQLILSRGMSSKKELGVG